MVGIKKILLVTLSLMIGANAWADYGWMPNPDKLFFSFGSDILRSSGNFTSSGGQAIQYQNPNTGSIQAVNLTAMNFWLEPEYGITEGWAIRLRLNVTTDSVSANNSAQGSLLSGSGLSPITVGIKMLARKENPSIVVEPTVKFPTNSNFIDASVLGTDLLASDGSVDIGLAMHTGYRHKHLLLAGSPEILVRSAGYAPAAIFKGAAGVSYPKGYALALVDFYCSLGNELLFDSSYNLHDTAGTGGSYYLLSGSPTLLTIGFKGGVRIMKQTFIEATFHQTAWGVRAPQFFQVGLNFLMTFDFHKPDTRPKIHEIPFDAEPETNPDGSQDSDNPAPGN